MIYRLVILNGERRGERITVTREPMRIGKAETCEIRFDDPEIAMIHAEISHKPEGLFIRDLGSMNRLLINNRETREVHPKHGDVVEVGHTRFLVQAYVQAEVQGEEEDTPRRLRQWLVRGGVTVVVISLLYAMYQCQPALPSRPPLAVKPATARSNLTTRAKYPAALPGPARPAATPGSTTNTAVEPIPVQPTAAAPLPPTNDTTKVKTVEPRAAKPSEPPPSAGAMETSAVPAAASTTQVVADAIAVAQGELEQAANALLESRVRDMMVEAQSMATNKGPEAAEQLLAAIEKIKPDFLEASVAHAAMLEEQGKLDPALALWTDIQHRAKAASPLAEQAEKKLKMLGRARDELVFPFVGRIKLVEASINKFPDNERYREMRLLNLRLVATELQKEIEADAVRVDVRFYDRDPQTGRIVPTSAKVPAMPLTIQGPWRATEEKTLEASYVAPTVEAVKELPAQYHGFVVRVHYFGALQDERIQPRDLPADVELAVPAAAAATNVPAATLPVNEP
jgi:pSer/pThr/pTyr-binding forkhead associated (FHA) protein